MSLPLILTIIFIILKLTGAIAWSWWWVCSPILLTFALAFIVAILAMVIGAASGKNQEEVMANLRRFSGL